MNGTTAANHRLANMCSSVPEWVTYLTGAHRQPTRLAKMCHLYAEEIVAVLIHRAAFCFCH